MATRDRSQKGPQDPKESLLGQEGLGEVLRSIRLPPGRMALKILQTNEHLAALERKDLKEEMKGRRAASRLGGSWSPSS